MRTKTKKQVKDKRWQRQQGPKDRGGSKKASWGKEKNGKKIEKRGKKEDGVKQEQ